ncbi:Mitochondrial carnitine/acylcarnitine carrier protein [Strongyloides ratti]|uniref:Mitochondrial carnitine/acylcarnitine carrier protein n=1 Tax=Strongyloides ratti TaxID=34506 RepID=A0A090L9H2_STRRB|nr:Mitochondrial carnitine/acylcarnitine carrier protein [Strongyloides ratti]CEF66397.1 Mitochondrial carnitine/acylcarnitine carrier protein [Strongyloides ratti]
MDTKTLYINSISGSFAAVNASIVGLPFDTIKTRLQASEKGKFKGPVDCFKKTFINEGFRGLFRGFIPIVLTCGPTYGLYYVINQYSLNFLTPNKLEINNLPIWKEVTCGGIAGAAICGILTPGERIKCYIQVKTKKISVIKAIKDIISTDGIHSLYRGFGATLIREIPMGAAYFSSYNIIRNNITQPNENLPLWKILVVGSIAGICGWTAALPGDVVKTKIQSSIGSNRKIKIFEVAKELFKTKGIKGFFIGYVPIVLRSIPVNAVYFASCESMKSLMVDRS